MTQPQSTPAEPPATEPPAPPATPPATSAAPAQPAMPPKAELGEKVEDLPSWAQKIISDARAEAAESRTKGKTAADAAVSELTQKLGKALGLVEDDKGNVDPDELAEQLGIERGGRVQAQTELAVYRAAGKHGGDAEALLDSRAFLTKLANLDPSADDFAAKVETAIKDAVKNNPKLKAGQAPPASGIPTTGGPGPGLDIDAAIAEAIKNGDHNKAIRLKRQKAYAPKG